MKVINVLFKFLKASKGPLTGGGGGGGRGGAFQKLRTLTLTEYDILEPNLRIRVNSLNPPS